MSRTGLTMRELEGEVFTLGNSLDVTNDSLFVVSVNRALNRLYSDRQIVRTIRLAARTIKPISHYKEIRCSNGDFMELPLVGKAYSMRIHGCGKYRIDDGDIATTYSVESMSEARLVKGFVSFGGKISFWGSFSFTIYDLVMYDEMYSQYPYDIPEYGAKRIFDLRELYGDFMSFISPPTDKYGNLIDNCRLYDGKVEVDPDYEGEIILSYRRLPTNAVPGVPELELEVPMEYVRLFTLLVASYYWNNTNENLSKQYEALYEEGMASLRSNSYQHIDCSYVNTNGWA